VSGLDLIGLDIRLHGGTVVDQLTERVTHIIFNTRLVTFVVFMHNITIVLLFSQRYF